MLIKVFVGFIGVILQQWVGREFRNIGEGGSVEYKIAKKGGRRRERYERRREEEGCIRPWNWGTRATHGLVGSRAHQSASPFPLCFAPKQVVGIIVDSSALCVGPPLDANQGQGEEKRREGRKRERVRKQGGWTAANGQAVSWQS